jgi:hypothetical protein
VRDEEEWLCSPGMTDLTVSAALNHLDSWKLTLRAENMGCLPFSGEGPL